MSRIPNTGNYHNEILGPGWYYNAFLYNLYFIIQSRGFYFLLRNVKPAFQKLGLYGGLAYTGLFYILARGKEPWTFKHGVSPFTISLCTSVADPWHFWHKSGSADPYFWLTDPDLTQDPDVIIFVSNLQDGN
jgi:hypothetical protein